MTTAHEDLIADDFTELLVERGQSVLYCRGSQTATVSMVKQQQRAEQIEAGDGLSIEMVIVDFKCLTSALPYTVPRQGDRLKSGGKTWEVCPQPGGNKCYEQRTATVTRIHTIEVH